LCYRRNLLRQQPRTTITPVTEEEIDEYIADLVDIDDEIRSGKQLAGKKVSGLIGIAQTLF
jgi:hypothetical protein